MQNTIKEVKKSPFSKTSFEDLHVQRFFMLTKIALERNVLSNI